MEPLSPKSALLALLRSIWAVMKFIIYVMIGLWLLSFLASFFDDDC